ncbi:D-alanyl-D-alanine carboxypeptidase family protein [Paenibacillus sacheonensis]|uniref:D-alanyl-D-alanine carboxypeptidase n=1 Tax=Paenibacillus sacheonensis TaxID=742054 RepID=A0A7X4YKS3_9BACL|nr:D-alanyl-D-alanine carboxypeptidase family protein [Paenibacillus sacheonensis]MBM7563244.1 D-alanyl-D-alanine carboxypeptidase/D-alanyl-D-alanine carboxypeptidase (penicillin-binding protein 5/6) [Paenibacillus sacheonensis]NBC68197.1 D-alanyl-D-alanine carboxypeptidase [Paenibacillus sacheonensis]
MTVLTRVRWLAMLLILIVLTAAGSAYADTPEQGELNQTDQTDRTPPNLASDSAILIDAKTGTVLYARNAEKEQFPASITKIITGIIAIESGLDLDSIVTTSKEARNEDGTRIYLEEGEQQTLINLLYGMLLNSGNDAATAIAEFVDGSKAAFAERMNRFVREKAGAAHTHFTNPSGLPDAAQYTTALDMAKISRYAMRNDLFRTIVGTKKMAWDGLTWKTTLINHNELLGNYEGVTGIKNGYTGDSGFTLVTSAKRDGLELIGVLLKSPTKSVLYKDMTKLLDYGFRYFDMQQVSTANAAYPLAGSDEPSFAPKEPLMAVVPRGEKPIITVSAAGDVLVQTSLGIETAGRLQPVSPNLGAIAKLYSEQSESVERAASKSAGGASEPSMGNKLRIFFVWIGLLLYLFLFAFVRVKRRRLGRGSSY